jgi:hypothetical protein
MELVDGVSLYDMITRQGPTTPESALAVLKGSLLGLAAAHSLGIVHRDYKPENVLVDRSGTSKLTDFGVAVRSGQDAPLGGTAFYMAPEQWDAAPATPATDIYAATAVFFECLTGQTPFSGEPLQLAAQHAAAAVPVGLVDEPLRELITRGMAKSAAARPANATDFVAELEATAAAAYGQDWEERGRRHLAERAAALLLLLLHAPATVGTGTGTANVATTLGPQGVAGGAKGVTTAKSAAGAAKGGLGAWQIAALYAAIFVVVFGGVAGALVGTGALKGNSRSAGGASAAAAGSHASASATASPAVTTAACRTPGVPALAYVTQNGSGGSANVSTVVVRCGTGAPQQLANGGGSALSWSADGTALAWVNGSGVLYVATAKAGTWTLRHWSCQCAGTAFFGDQAVSVDSQTAGGPMDQVKAVTQLLAFPPSGSGQPATLPVTGLPASSYPVSEFYVLGNVAPAGVVIGFGDPGGSDLGGNQLLFRVTSAGQATQYGHYTISQQSGPNSSIPFGYVSNFSVDQPGSRLAFATYSRAGGCGGSYTAYVLDAQTGAITIPKTPSGVGPNGWTVLGTWFDQAGTAYASLVPNGSTCQTGGFGNGQVASPTPKTGVPTVVKLQGGSWVKASTGAFQAAYGQGNWEANYSGSIQSYLDAASLTISDGSTHVSLPGQVRSFAWEP